MAVTNSDLMRAIEANHQTVEARLDRIEGQVVQTNGRVTRLELWRERVEGFKAAFSWGPSALAAAIGGAAAGVILYVVVG